jgi:chromate transporter
MSSGEPASPSGPAPSLRVNPTPQQLFLAFAQIALSGFGGVLVWTRRLIVQQRQWLTAEEFIELFAVCNVLPGGNIVNFSIVYGARAAGPLGSLAAVLGLMTPPFVLVLIAGTLYARYGEMPGLRGALAGLAAAAAGLIISTVVQLAEPMIKSRPRPGHLVALTCFLAVGILRMPLLLVLAVMVPIGIACAWWERR